MRWLFLLVVCGTVLTNQVGVAADLEGRMREEEAAANTAPCPPLPRLRLAGTTLSDGTAPARALIEDSDSGEQDLLDLNASRGSYRLSAISRDGAVLTGDHCTGEIRLTLMEGRSPRKADDLSQAVNFDRGDSTHVAGVLPASLLDRLGLKSGDIVAAVNGHDVTDSASAKAELSRLGTESLDSVSVKRDGRTTVLVNPESTAVRNFKPPHPSPQQSTAEGASTLAVGMALPSDLEER